jgi:preprotein translocase subunit SecG
MGIGYTLLLIVHVLICLFLILLVTVQNEKGGGLAGAFGGMGGSGAFTGSSAVTILTKITSWAAAAGFIVLLAISALGSRSQQAAMGDSDLKKAASGLSGAIPAAPQAAPLPSGDAAPGAVPGVPATEAP